MNRLFSSGISICNLESTFSFWYTNRRIGFQTFSGFFLISPRYEVRTTIKFRMLTVCKSCFRCLVLKLYLDDQYERVKNTKKAFSFAMRIYKMVTCT